MSLAADVFEICDPFESFEDKKVECVFEYHNVILFCIGLWNSSSIESTGNWTWHVDRRLACCHCHLEDNGEDSVEERN